MLLVTQTGEAKAWSEMGTKGPLRIVSLGWDHCDMQDISVLQQYVFMGHTPILSATVLKEHLFIFLVWFLYTG